MIRSCYDCHLDYEDDGFQDLIIPNWAWRIISPTKNEGGLLCPNCILKRLAKAGIDKIPSAFTSGPLAYEVRDWIRRPMIWDTGPWDYQNKAAKLKLWVNSKPSRRRANF